MPGWKRQRHFGEVDRGDGGARCRCNVPASLPLPDRYWPCAPRVEATHVWGQDAVVRTRAAADELFLVGARLQPEYVDRRAVQVFVTQSGRPVHRYPLRLPRGSA